MNHFSQPCIVDLAAIDPTGDECFGGKARGLARLIRAGASVPDGIALAATTRSLDSWSLDERDALLTRVEPLLRQGPVAVRSSACGEDGQGRSFAGVFETVLGVTTPAGLLDAARRCIASGAGPRAMAYASTQSPFQVGLVVQSMVDARAAGVCFTVDPMGHDRAIVLEAVRGLGDSLVSGHAAPEQWRVYRGARGRLEVPATPARDGAGVLTLDQAIAIAGSADLLASALGGALDLEWALDAAGTVWWLQARPITAAVPPPPPIHVDRGGPGTCDGPVTVWANFNVRETLPGPLCPMVWTLWRDPVTAAFIQGLLGLPPDSPFALHRRMIDRVEGRIYWNLNAVLMLPLMERIFEKYLTGLDVQAGRMVPRLMADGVLRRRMIPGGGGGAIGRPSWRQVGAIPAMALRLLPWAVPGEAMRRLERMGARIDARRGRDLAAMSEQELIDEILWALDPRTLDFHGAFQAIGVWIITFLLALWALGGDERMQRVLAAGGKPSLTTRISLAMDELVRDARPLAEAFGPDSGVESTLARLEASPGGARWQRRFADFLEMFGHRCPREFDLAEPRWSESPGMLLGAIRQSLRTPPSEPLADRLARLSRDNAQVLDTAIAALPAWRRPVARALVALAHQFMPLREAPKHYAMKAFAHARRAIIALGTLLEGDGRLPSLADVWFLEWAELAALAISRSAIAPSTQELDRRRALHAHFLAARPDPIIRSDGVPVTDPVADSRSRVDTQSHILVGSGVSSGRATGPVRRLDAPDADRIEPGDVLVVVLADPGWTPLFPRVGAIVMEVGGLMCHAAVVARELGIPAVFGVEGAMRLLSDGQRVTVDGDSGRVFISGGEQER